MAEFFDVAVVGLGAMGSAAVYHLARRGVRVLGLDRFRPPHIWGSSHGESRIIREAYFEHPAYVPLVQRAYTLWAELEEASGRPLFRQTGGVMIGPPDGELVSGALLSARIHGLSHKVLSAADVRARYPVFEPSGSFVAVWEPRAGVLFPEACIETHLDLAGRHGAVLHYEEPVTEWRVEGDAVRLTTPRDRYQAGRLLLSAGAWLGRLVPELDLPLTIERQVLYWFRPAAHADAFSPERCPIYLWESETGQYFYGFPDLGSGVKAARHYQGEPADPDALNRTVRPEEEAAIRALLARFMPDANGPLVQTAVCMYTNTPDHHFVIDRHPAHPQVLIASPCSGHGFKFSSAIGELAAGLLTGGSTEHDIGLFRLERLASQPSGPLLPPREKGRVV